MLPAWALALFSQRGPPTNDDPWGQDEARDEKKMMGLPKFKSTPTKVIYVTSHQFSASVLRGYKVADSPAHTVDSYSKLIL